MLTCDTGFSLSPAYLAGLLGANVSFIEPLDGGRNSRTFKVKMEDGSRYTSKLYLDPTADGKSRMTAEFSSLEFLHRKGVDCVPRPIVADPAHECAVYEFVEGAKVDSSQVTLDDVDQVSRFLLRLHEFKDAPDSYHLPDAAEACFSVQALVHNLESRLGKLQAGNSSLPQSEAMRRFLATQFCPALDEIVSWCRRRVESAGMSMEAELEHRERTLNPSDFGFHNCLRRPDGQLVFLDFEYFGWDDPAKMVCDFLLHPGMRLSFDLKRRFVDNILGVLDRDQRLVNRIAAVYPLFGLKWCLIMLNPFLDHYRLRRGIAEGSGLAQDELLGQQLDKARGMLSIIGRGYEHFPY